jgi:acyl-CoA thioesterase
MRAGRSGITDVTVTRADGTLIAEFRGNSRTVAGSLVEGA